MKYRSELLFGDGYRDAAAVMAHEVFELENTDILTTLRTTILKNSSYAHDLEILEEELTTFDISDDDENGDLFELYLTHDSYSDLDCASIQFFETILHEIASITGKSIRYVLWLCDTKEDVYHYDIRNELTDADIDVYEESDIILSDMGHDGKLYGYETIPKPICTLPELESCGIDNISLRSKI